MEKQKVAFVSLTIPMALMAEDMNVSENCTDDELEKAAYEYASEIASIIHFETGWAVNDIECDIREW